MSALPELRHESRALFRSQGMSGYREQELRRARDEGVAIGVVLMALIVIGFRVFDHLRWMGML